MTHYLHVEAINLGAAIFDTNQISIIRGGSLLLKQAIDDITNNYSANLNPISTGASLGLFEIIGENPPSDVKNDIIQFLNKEPKYRYFTFVVADTQSGDFQKAKETLIAKARFMQLQQASVSIDGLAIKTAEPCAVDGVRKANHPAVFPNGKKLTNPFARLKWVYGRRQRSQLYQNELQALQDSMSDSLSVQIPKNFKVTKDLAMLSETTEFPALNGKIAVIYFDGNGFGKTQAQLVKSKEDQKEFDLQIKNLRRIFLAELLKAWDNDRTCKNGDTLRLETLLWGGDEMLFVVPAWKGFEFIQLFYQTSQTWEIKLNGETRKLSHAGGIVFCQQNSPIYKMRDLAQQLADRIKNHPDRQGRTNNYYDYLVLESIDYPAEELDTFFSYRYGNLAQYRTYLSAQGLANITSETIAELEKSLPKSQVYGLAHAATQLTITTTVEGERMIENDTQYVENLNHLFLIAKDETKLKGQLKNLEALLFPQLPNIKLTPENNSNTNIIEQALMWLHLVQCWDYLWPEPEPKDENKAGGQQ